MLKFTKMKGNKPQDFSKAELARYSRHLIIPDFNIEGQRKLKKARVLVVGSGGLGAPLLQYLAAAGAGTIGVVDYDKVEDSNLQRQVLFNTDDVGKPKVVVAKKRLEKLNPYINIVSYNTPLTADNALDIIQDQDYDLVADGTDNFPTRYLVNDACVLAGIPYVYASIFRFEGQLSVFNYTDEHGETGPNYRDLFPAPPPPGHVQSCAEGGVIGVLPGILGSLQANEVIKVLTDTGETLSGRLFIFDALKFQTRTLKLEKQKKRPKIDKLIDYEQFCGMPTSGEQAASEKSDNEIQEMTVRELKEKLDRGEDLQVIDVREPHEYDIVNIGGELIPLGKILQHKDKIKQNGPVVIHCRSGSRSAEAVQKLKQKYGFDNLYNLKGGILAYAKTIDPSLPVY